MHSLDVVVGRMFPLLRGLGGLKATFDGVEPIYISLSVNHFQLSAEFTCFVSRRFSCFS